MGNEEPEPPPPPDAKDFPASPAEQMRIVVTYPAGLTCPICELPIGQRQTVVGNDKGDYAHSYCWETA